MLDDDGNIWASGHRRQYHTEPSDKFPGMVPPYVEDTVVKISRPTGSCCRRSPCWMPSTNRHSGTILFPDGGNLEARSPCPIRCVSTMSSRCGPRMAPAFPCSPPATCWSRCAYRSTIMVLDPKTGLIKWTARGPWFGQHDPHFLPNGRISIYDNRDLYNSTLPPGASPIAQPAHPAAGSGEAAQVETIYRRHGRSPELHRRDRQAPVPAERQLLDHGELARAGGGG